MPNAPIDRRQFARRLAGGAASVAGVAGIAALPPAADAARQETPSARNAEPKDRPDPPVRPPSEVDLLLEVVQRRYPDARLDADVLAGIAGKLRGQLGRSRILAQSGLTNADEPAFVFAAYRPREGR